MTKLEFGDVEFHLYLGAQVVSKGKETTVTIDTRDLEPGEIERMRKAYVELIPENYKRVWNYVPKVNSLTLKFPENKVRVKEEG